MRCIDATTLKAEFTGNFSEFYVPAYIKAIIDNAPTIEMPEIKHSNWIINSDGFLECANCGEPAVWFYDRSRQKKTPYCPYCGARMDGKNE